MTEVLPDSRAKTAKNRVFRGSQAWVPVYCANCGKEGGMCPEENMTFMFYLCTPCLGTHGAIAGTMTVPDKAFYDAVANEQLEAYGRFLRHDEVLKVIEDDATPLATLLKEAK